MMMILTEIETNIAICLQSYIILLVYLSLSPTQISSTLHLLFFLRKWLTDIFRNSHDRVVKEQTERKKSSDRSTAKRKLNDLLECISCLFSVSNLAQTYFSMICDTQFISVDIFFCE